MMSTLHISLCVDELCESLRIDEDVLGELLAHHIIRPVEEKPERRFDPHVVMVATRALRLQRDLDLNWPGVALALELLDQMEELRQENRRLRRRLARFEE